MATNGSQPAIEEARTILENAYPIGAGPPPPKTIGEASYVSNSANNSYQQLAAAAHHRPGDREERMIR